MKEMVGGVSYCAEEGIVSILSKVSECRLVVTVKPKAPSATEKGFQALPVCCCSKTPPCTRDGKEPKIVGSCLVRVL